MGLSKIGKGIFDPIIEFVRPIPPLAYLPLVIIWLGIGEPSKVVVIAIAMLAPITIATVSGVRSVPIERINAARSMGATSLQVVRYVILPSTFPSILIGLRIALGAGWSTLVAAELVAATRGLGFVIQSAAAFLVTDVVHARHSGDRSDRLRTGIGDPDLGAHACAVEWEVVVETDINWAED